MNRHDKKVIKLPFAASAAELWRNYLTRIGKYVQEKMGEYPIHICRESVKLHGTEFAEHSFSKNADHLIVGNDGMISIGQRVIVFFMSVEDSGLPFLRLQFESDDLAVETSDTRLDHLKYPPSMLGNPNFYLKLKEFMSQGEIDIEFFIKEAEQ